VAHLALVNPLHAWLSKLEQMLAALVLGTLVCVGATVVPPPPGTDTVTA
jgi:hypothetical protein